MPTNRDLVEAQTFARRRLVAAFLSGAPGGREVDHARPGRTVVCGVALAVLVLAGAAVTGLLSTRPDSTWLDEGSFVISADTGEQYVVLVADDDPALHRVPNLVSAQLVLGDPSPPVHTVGEEHVRDVPRGEDLGIAGAPSVLPAARDLLGSGWTACTADGAGVRVTAQAEPAARTVGGSAFLVTTGRDLWLVAGSSQLGTQGEGPAYRMRITGDASEVGTFVTALGFAAEGEAALVSERWLRLFPQAPALAPAAFGVRRSGPALYADAETDFHGLRVGDLVEASDGATYLLADGAPQRLSPFAATVYDALGVRARRLGGVVRARFASPQYPAEWPVDVPAPLPSGDLCAVLESRSDGPPRTVLAHRAEASASARPLRHGEHVTVVARSGGAYVRAGSGRGATYVIDGEGSRHLLRSPDAAEQLGYAGVVPPLVPQTWLDHFDRGVSLSVEAARRPGRQDAGPDD